MASEWSRSTGWRSYEAWKRWYRQVWGGLPASAQLASGEWRAVYRAFSEPDGVQAEVEIAAGQDGAAAVDEAEVRRRARASLLRYRDLIASHLPGDGGPVVVVQVVMSSTGQLRMGAGPLGAPPTAPRRPLEELVALALEDLGA